MNLIKGDTAVDDRGIVRFVNDFDFKGVKRFYTVENFAEVFTRGWHGHKREAKYMYVIRGDAMVETKPLDGGEIERHLLKKVDGNVLYIPPGYFNAVTTFGDTEVMVFSTATLKQSLADDIREEYE